MDVFTFASPFVAALLASFLTYFFAVRTKKHEIASTQRLEAFKAIHKLLLRFRKYYLARIGDHDWSEFAIDTNSLEADNRLSPLEQLDKLDTVLADNQIFLPAKSRTLFDELFQKISVLHSSELHVAALKDDLAKIDAMQEQLPLFQSVLDAIERCIEQLYRDLGLPR